MSFGMMVLLLLPNIVSTPIPTSGGGLPAPGTGAGIPINHIPPLSVSWSMHWPVSPSTRDSKISVCKIWCGLTPSPLTVGLITPTSTTSLPSQVSLEEVSETGSLTREGILCLKSWWGMWRVLGLWAYPTASSWGERCLPSSILFWWERLTWVLVEEGVREDCSVGREGYLDGRG